MLHPLHLYYVLTSTLPYALINHHLIRRPSDAPTKSGSLRVASIFALFCLGAKRTKNNTNAGFIKQILLKPTSPILTASRKTSHLYTTYSFSRLKKTSKKLKRPLLRGMQMLDQQQQLREQVSSSSALANSKTQNPRISSGIPHAILFTFCTAWHTCIKNPEPCELPLSPCQ